MSSAAYLRFFEEEIDLRSIMFGAQELPPFPGKATNPWYRLYSLFKIAYCLQNGLFEAAQVELMSVQPDEPPLNCQFLVATWLEAEVGDLDQAIIHINEFIALIESGLSPAPARRGRHAALIQFDDLMSRRWAYILRLYLVSLHPDISKEQIEQCRRDIASARALGVAEATLLRADFLVRFALARQLRSVDQVLAATRDWQQLCREFPLYGDGQEYQLEAIMALEFDNRFTEALEWISESLPHQEDPYELLVIKARILKRIGRIQESLVVCEHLIAHYPHDFSGYTLRSNAHFLLGENDKAMADAQLACQMDPENPNSYLARAFVLLQVGQYEKALADFEKTLELDPQRYDAMRGQGKCLSMLGRDYQAMASFQKL
ncbi:MAG: hypothetical protein H6Q62_178, partial [Firmicutes bacterium]|nr:hypothetical protein [Bacillota bacterium]